MNVNIGSGERPRDGFVNVDFRPEVNPEIIADAEDVKKIGLGLYDHLLAEHILEHFSFLKTVEVLKKWRSLLKDGGTFEIHVPNGEWQVNAVANGQITWDEFVDYAYGAQTYEGNFHFTSFNADLLRRCLEEAGFKNVTVTDVTQVLVAFGNK